MITKKEDRFKKIASRRTQQIIDSLDRLSKCSNTNNYSYNEKDVNKIFKSIEEDLRLCKAMFKKKNKKNKKFTL